MKVTIPISILDKRSENLGIEINEKLTDFCFDSKCFVGYWIDKEDEGNEIKVYIGSQSFLTPYDKKIIETFDSILNHAL